MQEFRNGTQADRTLAYLLTGRRLTSRTALTCLGIISFPKRICELRQRQIRIEQRRITVKNCFDEDCTVNEYWLPSDEIARLKA